MSFNMFSLSTPRLNIVSRWLCISLFTLIHPTTVKAQDTFTYHQWERDLLSLKYDYQSLDELWIENLPSGSVVVALYPQSLSLALLDWVGRGGILFLTLNPESISIAQPLLTALDLKPHIPNDSPQQYIVGAWPFPKQKRKQNNTLHRLLTPWLTVNPLTFEEGDSWFKGEITPIAISENGYSLGYRIRYGQGTFTLLGDGEALSDQLRMLPENRRLAQAILWWLQYTVPKSSTSDHPSEALKNIRKNSSTGLKKLFFLLPNSKLLSIEEETSLKHKLSTLFQDMKQWFSNFIFKQFNFYQHLHTTLVLVLLGLCIILYYFIRARSWAQKVILRHK